MYGGSHVLYMQVPIVDVDAKVTSHLSSQLDEPGRYMVYRINLHIETRP